MDIQNLEKDSLVILRAGDLQDYSEKLAARQAAPAPAPTDDTPIPQPQAVKEWKTTRQRLANLRRQGKIEALVLNGRIYYRPSAYYNAMHALTAHKKQLV